MNRATSDNPNVRMFFKGAGAPSIMRRNPRGARTGVLFLATLLLLTTLPVVQAGFEISISATPMAMEVNPGENGTYQITVHNTGDEDMVVQLSTTEDQSDCQGFSSTIQQITAPIVAGTSEVTDMSVTLASNAEDSCETTVSGTATAAPGGTPASPEQADVIVTTTAGSGSGGTVTGVDLSASVTDKQYDGTTSNISWAVTVENTGQATETIQLSFEDNASCQSTLNPEVSPDNIQLGAGDTEVVDVYVDVPDGTQAGDHCFGLKADVTAPQTPEQASDILRLNLEVPELKECTAVVSPTSIAVNPEQTKTASVTYYNDGNADWTVGFSVSGSKNWIAPNGGSTRLLLYDNGNGQTTITFDITPDDSMPAGEIVTFAIDGLDGSSIKCTSYISVQLGQSHDGSVTLQSSRIDNIDPGSTRSAILTVNNLGNGGETFSLSASGAEGWAIALSAGQITLEGRHDAAGSSADLQIDITAPSDALATDELTFGVELFSTGGDLFDSDTLTVTVAASRSMSANMPALEQWGKTDDIAKFPITFTNTGNVQDSFRLTACDEPPTSNPSVCDAPAWPARFSDEAGSEVTTVSLAPGQTVTVTMDVTVQGEDEFEAEKFQARIRNLNDGSVEERFDLTVIVSNHIYKMAMAHTEPGEFPDLMEVELPPDGEFETWVIITNVGTSSFPESAIIEASGIEGVVNVVFFFENGTEVNGEIPVVTGGSVTIRVAVVIKDGAENGAGGILTISTSSTRNAAELSSVRISVDVRTINKVGFEVDGEVERTIEYGEIARILVNVTNEGNVEETVRLLSSNPMRGWSIELTDEEVTLLPGETRQVEVIIKPPTNLEQPDTFEFTITAEPASAPVASQPIDLSVSASPSAGLFGAGSNLQTIGLVVLATLIIGAMVSAIRSRRNLD